MAYRMLARNQPLTQQVQMAVQGKRQDGAPQCPTPPSSPFQQQNVTGQQVQLLRLKPIDYLLEHVCFQTFNPFRCYALFCYSH